MASTSAMSRPSLSKETPRSRSQSTSRPSLVYNRLQEALSLLPARRSPTKASTSTTSAATTSATTTATKRSNPLTSLFRHKPSASAPAAVPVTTSSTRAPPSFPDADDAPPPVPPKSAPASRAVSPLVAQKSAAPLRSRPTIPFASSRLTQPTAASSARTLPPVSSPPSVSRSSSSSTVTPTHARKPSRSKALVEPPPPLPVSPRASEDQTQTRSRVSPSPTIEPAKRSSPELNVSSPLSPTSVRPRFPTTTSSRAPISPPPSAFGMKTQPHSLPRKRSRTFPDPNDPVVPVPPSSQSLSRSMKTANRIIEAFEPSPRSTDEFDFYSRPVASPTSPVAPSIRSKSTSPTPLSPIRPIRPPGDAAFMAIPSRSRVATSNRGIQPSTTSTENGTRVRPIAVTSPLRPAFHSSHSAPLHLRSPSENSLSPPPRRPVPTLTSSSGTAAQSRRLARPPLRPLQTSPTLVPRGNNISIVRSSSPVSPETRSSSASPKTPAPYAEPTTYLTSDDESKAKKRHFKSFFNRKRPDSLVSSSTLTSAVSASGTSNASAAFGGMRPPIRQPKAPSTFGGLPEEDDPPPMSMQTRRGIKRHPHPVSEVPYPISYEEMVLQGEKHTQDLLSTVLQQKAYHFTPMDSFSKLKNVLDIGCGRGHWLMDAAKECKHATLVGFDIVNVFYSPQEMKERCGLSDSQIARIEFVQGNFFNTLPFLPDRFDYIRLAFLELAIPESKWVPLLKDCWRILKPGGHIEVIIESQLFPTVWSYDKLRVHEDLENEYRAMLEARDIPPATNIGEKMFFDAFARVQTHKHVSVCIAPRPAGRSSLDAPVVTSSPGKFSSLRSVHSPWSSEPLVPSGMTSPTPFGRPSLDRSRTPVDVMPPSGQLVTSRTCNVPGIVVSPDVFIPVPEDLLFTYASHGAMLLNATRLASFSDKYPQAVLDEFEDEWQRHVERYWQYERSNRLRLGFRMNQFDDDEDEDMPTVGPTQGRWKWAKCDDDLERPLEIRRFRAWSLSKPVPSR